MVCSMNVQNNDTKNYTLSQLMVTAAAREIADGEVVFVGMRLPLLGFLLAKSTPVSYTHLRAHET